MTLPDKSTKTIEAKSSEGLLNIKMNPSYIFFNLKQGDNLSNIESNLFKIGSNNQIPLCTVYVDWFECLKFPMEFNPNKAYVMADSNIKIYMRTRWVPKNEYPPKLSTSTKIQQNPNKPKDTKQIASDKPIEEFEEGTIKVYVVRAKGLIPADKDTSDPFCTITFGAGTPYEVSQKTHTCPPTLTPNWEQQFLLPIKWNKGKPIPNLKFDVFDENKLLKNVLLGNVIVDWAECYHNRVQWKINQYFKLENSIYKGKETIFGDLYIIINWIPREIRDTNEKPLDLDTNLEVGKHEIDRITGKICIYAIHGKGLWSEKNNNACPYLKITYPDHKIEQSLVKSNTLNPIWKQVIIKQIDIPKQQMAPLLIEVKDKNYSIDNIGYYYIDWQKCFDKPGKTTIYESNNI